MTRRGLGKGLDALFQTYDSFAETDDRSEKDDKILEIKIHSIDPNMDQPRRSFNQESIEELSRSISEHGVVQPIIVKPMGNRYTIIAGERRWRAARAAGLETIPVILKDIDEKQMLEIALIENLQRENLNPMEEADGINSLIKSYGLTQEQVAKRLGKSRPAISNALRLLNLPKEVRLMLEEDKITTGHARALLGLGNQEEIIEMARLIIKDQLSVRETERIIKKARKEKTSKKPKESSSKPSYILEIENRMEKSLGTRVTIQQGKKKGIIEIEYYSNEDLERIIEMMS